MSINAVLKARFSDEDRSAERYRLQIQATGSQADAGAAEILVQDLSATGFLIESDYPFATGDALTVDMPGIGKVDASLVWTSGRFFGGEFARPLSRDALKSLLSHSKVVGPSFRATGASDRGGATAARFAEPVEELPSFQPLDGASLSQEQRLPLPRRAQIIILTSLLLWSGIAFAGWQALS
jgi:hypothetical protein